VRTWLVSFELVDDGVEDPDGEVKGKYFSARELKRLFVQIKTSGLKVKNIALTRLRRSQL